MGELVLAVDRLHGKRYDNIKYGKIINMIDKILEKYNLKYEDLKTSERETLNTWINALSQSELTVSKVKDYLASMRASVEQELSQVGYNNTQDIFLKARLRNYILLEAFLSSPDKAKEALEKALLSVGKK